MDLGGRRGRQGEGGRKGREGEGWEVERVKREIVFIFKIKHFTKILEKHKGEIRRKTFH